MSNDRSRAERSPQEAQQLLALARNVYDASGWVVLETKRRLKRPLVYPVLPGVRRVLVMSATETPDDHTRMIDVQDISTGIWQGIGALVLGRPPRSARPNTSEHHINIQYTPGDKGEGGRLYIQVTAPADPPGDAGTTTIIGTISRDQIALWARGVSPDEEPARLPPDSEAAAAAINVIQNALAFTQTAIGATRTVTSGAVPPLNHR